MGLPKSSPRLFQGFIPQKGRSNTKIVGFPVQRVFRVAADMDTIIVVQREKLDEVLRKLTFVDGIQDTNSYVLFQPIK